MLAVLGPFVAHQFQDLFPLLEVQLLGGTHHVDVLIEVVMGLPIGGCGQIPGDVEGGAVFLGDEDFNYFVRVFLGFQLSPY